ncbi:MAG: tRNA (adenosine(37)-N6)-dimethylallyltransferase MiaA [Dysgonamonadaceae bacterium]|jgi:tRNA dimethylallyltransferase|nr:tRNA (adenosine(37)-N6)-dimethylallyltransferase MiaA [Dysgonamonadaceae bacterium]
MEYELITIIGPTASGKTALAAKLAAELETEIISADSRQVYRGMDIGTGKDIKDYTVNGKEVKYHLIDICDAGEKYNIFRFQHDFHETFNRLKAKGGTPPVFCGGSGLYIESVLGGFNLPNVPQNNELRKQLKDLPIDRLGEILKSYKNIHNKTDLDSPHRAIRAIEIEEFNKTHEYSRRDSPKINSLIICINVDRDNRREKISKRLSQRLNEGLVDEIKNLLNTGINPDDLIYYGLEYKFVTLYVIGKINYKEMYCQLETAIHQFAKRQMTWFRGMERRGFKINNIDASIPNKEKIKTIKDLLLQKST